MHDAPSLSLFLVAGIALSLACLAFAAGYVASAIVANRRDRHDTLSMAERADVNGARLLVIARGLRDTPVRIEERVQLDGWARDLEDIAVAHLECINAINLDALHIVRGEQAPYLGEFVPGHRQRRAFASGGKGE